jgi:hypothetical protein
MIMERTEILDLIGQLRLFGMKNAYDEILVTPLKPQHEPQRFAGDLLKAEISEKQACSIKRWSPNPGQVAKRESRP